MLVGLGLAFTGHEGMDLRSEGLGVSGVEHAGREEGGIEISGVFRGHGFGHVSMQQGHGIPRHTKGVDIVDSRAVGGAEYLRERDQVSLEDEMRKTHPDHIIADERLEIVHLVDTVLSESDMLIDGPRNA